MVTDRDPRYIILKNTFQCDKIPHQAASLSFGLISLFNVLSR